jgi:allophanate hydrolase subunit 2
MLLRSEQPAVAVLRGPHADRFADPLTFLSGTYRVSDRSDRAGVRLSGPELSTSGGEILSYGLLPGAVQVPRGGEPIVALADAGTTGGYPVIAVVCAADIGTVAQAIPGESLSFYEVDRAAALESLRAVRRWLDAV